MIGVFCRYTNRYTKPATSVAGGVRWVSEVADGDADDDGGDDDHRRAHEIIHDHVERVSALALPLEPLDRPPLVGVYEVEDDGHGEEHPEPILVVDQRGEGEAELCQDFVDVHDVVVANGHFAVVPSHCSPPEQQQHLRLLDAGHAEQVREEDEADEQWGGEVDHLDDQSSDAESHTPADESSSAVQALPDVLREQSETAGADRECGQEVPCLQRRSVLLFQTHGKPSYWLVENKTLPRTGSILA